MSAYVICGQLEPAQLVRCSSSYDERRRPPRCVGDVARVLRHSVMRSDCDRSDAPARSRRATTSRWCLPRIAKTIALGIPSRAGLRNLDALAALQDTSCSGRRVDRYAGQCDPPRRRLARARGSCAWRSGAATACRSNRKRRKGGARRAKPCVSLHSSVCARTERLDQLWAVTSDRLVLAGAKARRRTCPFKTSTASAAHPFDEALVPDARPECCRGARQGWRLEGQSADRGPDLESIQMESSQATDDRSASSGSRGRPIFFIQDVLPRTRVGPAAGSRLLLLNAMPRRTWRVGRFSAPAPRRSPYPPHGARSRRDAVLAETSARKAEIEERRDIEQGRSSIWHAR